MKDMMGKMFVLMLFVIVVLVVCGGGDLGSNIVSNGGNMGGNMLFVFMCVEIGVDVKYVC